jgi:BRCT domain type II-containing protein
LILGDNPGEAKVAFAKKNNIKIVSYGNFLNNFKIN